MLSDTQRDVLRRLADGKELCLAYGPFDGYAPWINRCFVGALEITEDEMIGLEDARLITMTRSDWPRKSHYTITDAGRAALGEGWEEGE